MELCLSGSQISLATRQTPRTPPINYPSVHVHRPASASLSHQRNRMTSRLTRRRPLSAESRFVKSGSSVKFNLENHSSNSSLNIFKLLIEDPKPMTKKYWSSNKSSIEKERLSEEKQKSKAEAEDSTSCGDSVQEIIAVKANNMKNSNHRDSKKPYDLWVNENADRSETAPSAEKKLDLPGRVSFSTNDVYEIDYDEYDDDDDHESASSKTSANIKAPVLSQAKGEPPIETERKPYVKENYQVSNSDNEMDEVDYRFHTKSSEFHSKSSEFHPKSSEYQQKSPEKSSQFSQVIKDYKMEVGTSHHTINHTPTHVQLNNSKAKPTVASKLNQSTNPVIKNYLKAKEQEVDGFNNRVTITTANKKLNDLSKKPKTFKDLSKPKQTNSVVPKSPAPSSATKQTKSPAQTSMYARQDSNLDEFQIEKVVSWMTVNEDNFSEFECSMAGNVNENTSKHDSTYQEIADIIKEIEHDRKDCEDFKTLKTDVEFKLNTILNSIESPDGESPLPGFSDGDIGSNNKIKEIFSYLDEVDSSCDKALMATKGCNVADRDNIELEFALEPDVIEDVPKISDLLMLPNHQLARRIVKLSLRANELSNAIQLSKEHVSNVRGDKAKALRLEKLNGQNRLKDQKKHYEEIVARHQTFIEQLIKDKSALCEKVAQATRRVDSQNQAWEHRMKTEVDKAKEQALAGEKIRREKWVRENTKKIKELTVKGLELEINKMSTNHKQEIEALKRQHHLDILKAIEETKETFEKSEKNIRESYADEREQAIERERKAIKERFEKQMDDERKSAEQQRLRLISNFEVEKDRLYQELREKEQQFEMKKEELINEKMEALEDAKETYNQKMKQREAKHQTELSKIQEQFEADFRIWKRETETKMKLRESERENSIRDQFRAERDRQIDAIVAKVDAESIQSQQDFEMKQNRLREKYEHEIRELESSEAALKDKYINARTRLAESEANNQNLKAVATQMELQLSHATKLCEKFTAEKDTMKEEARMEIKNELLTSNKEHEMEIQRIYSRVQLAIQKKDATLTALQKENAALRERNLKLDAIIRQQRKDYCTK